MARRKPRPRAAPRSSPSAWDELHPTLDLHGETADAARRRTERWLHDKRDEGVATVRVITGRGAHSVGPPVLRGEVEALLAALRGSVISGFTVESGGGAFRVELQRARRGRAESGKPAPASTARSLSAFAGLDPELRQRVEEALWELGVDPTPELVRAEVRRLQMKRES